MSGSLRRICRGLCCCVVKMIVSQSERYENFRAGYSSTKRPVNVPNIRSVQPRLEHENASDDVKGLGRRKIPASSQRPTRSTNVPIVYSRLSKPRELQQQELQQGDVMFVGKSNTEFGAGVNRLTRVANLSDVNLMLSDESNFIFEDDSSLESLLKARQTMSREYADLSKHCLLYTSPSPRDS